MTSKEGESRPSPEQAQPITPAQQIQFDRLRLGSFNRFDGDWVADRLLEKRPLWKSVVFGRFIHDSLVELRDLAEGILDADELYLLAEKATLDELMDEIHAEWNATETSWITREGTVYVRTGWFPFEAREFWNHFGADLKPDEAVVRVWWD